MSDLIRVLFVDDDENLLSAIKRNLRKDLDIVVATGAIEGLRKLDKSGPFSVIVSDQNMPKVDGATFLAKVKTHFPRVVRVMLTGNTDQQTAVSATNEAEVFRFVGKPCSTTHLLKVVREAHDHHLRMSTEAYVLEETVAGTIKIMTDMLAMAYPDRFKRTCMVTRWAEVACKTLNIPYTWELKTACALWPIGDTLLPAELAEKRNSEESLTSEERALVLTSCVSASEMIGNVPRLQGVAKLMLMSTPAGSKMAENVTLTPDARLLRILIDVARCMNPDEPNKVNAAFNHLVKNINSYDAGLFTALPPILANVQHGTSVKELKEITAGSLSKGDLLTTDLVDDTGKLILASGQIVSETTANAVSRLYAGGVISMRLKVMRSETQSAA
ncbi:response regulator [Hirschia litorea]|uniref:Response regulator n=1 Tax=Hirschia litorea TaxID=1199156 RepID=A0ABW2IIG5_9PROT